MRTIMPAGLCCLAAALLFCPSAVAEDPGGDKTPRLEDLMPRWGVGDRWTLETVSRPLNIRADVSQAAVPPPVRWQFDVAAIDESPSGACFRVEVTCQRAGLEIPKTVLWFDRDSFALRCITSHVPVPGGFEEMTIRYDSSSGQPAPILGPLSAVPIDTPVLYSGAKGLETFCYTSHLGPTERKELGDVGFVHRVQQEITPLSREDVGKLFAERFSKSLVDDAFAKSLRTLPVTEVRLKSQGREVRQLWQPRRPWPIYCDNGYSVSRLVSVERSPRPHGEEERP